MKRLLIIGFLASIAGCIHKDKDWSSAGYQDGYAVGYNTTCGYNGNMIHGRWNDKEYSSSYASGMQAGIADCKRGVKL